MMPRLNVPRAVTTIVALVGLVSGCHTTDGEQTADTNTSWAECEQDSDCPGGRCVVGLCEGTPPPTGLTQEDAGDRTDTWPVRLSEPDNQGSPPSIAWVGDRFVVAWWELSWTGSDMHIARADLETDGTFSVNRTAFDGYTPWTVVDSAGRVAVAGASAVGLCGISVYDADLALVGSGNTSCTSDVTAAPLGAGQWVLAHGVDTGDTDSFVIERFDPLAAEPLSGPIAVGTAPAGQRPAVFATADAAVVVWPVGGDTVGRIVSGLGALDESLSAELTISGGAQMDWGYGFGEIDGQRMLFGTDTRVLWDVNLSEGGTPFFAMPQVSTRVADRPTGVTAAPELGVLGVCYATGPGPYGGAGVGQDGASFVAVDADGRVVSGPTVVADGIDNIGGCDVAWSGEEFMVVYWAINNDSSEIRAKRMDPALPVRY